MVVRTPVLTSSQHAVPRIYHGWVVLVVAAAAMVGTLPARTQGLGLITEPLLADLGIGRVAYAELNLWATLAGSLSAIGIGRVLDRLGSRLVLTVVALALGAVVCLMSRATSFATLAACVTLTRGLGQSALSVVSLAMVGQWFVRRIERAMAIYSVGLSVGFMLAFPLVGSLVQERGWPEAWFALGCALMLGLAPLGLVAARRGPELCGLLPDGEPGPVPGGARRVLRGDELPGHGWSTALATPAFWVFALGAALYGLVASGIGLFNESILAERGFGPEVYHRTLVVTALTALAGNFLGGWLATRVALGRLLSAALFVLAGGLAALPFVRALAEVLAWAAAMGLGGGLVMVLFFSAWPRLYGRRHLGRIQGSAQAITVLASAIGPLCLAWCVEWTGSYRTLFELLALAIAAVGAAALLVSLPRAFEGASPVPDAAGDRAAGA
jgi:MFS family permease